MVERLDRRHYRSLLYVPARDDLYVIGWRRATALCHGELALPALAGQRIFIGHIAYSIVDAEMVDILPTTGSRYLIGPDGRVDEAEKAADSNAAFLTMVPTYSDPRRESAAFRMQRRRVEVSRWLFGPETTPELFARFADYTVRGLRRPKFHQTMRALREFRLSRQAE